MRLGLGTCVVLKEGTLSGNPRSRRAVIVAIYKGSGRAADPEWQRETSYVAWAFGPDNRGSAYGGGMPVPVSLDSIERVSKCKQVEIRALLDARNDMPDSGLVSLDEVLAKLQDVPRRRRR